MQLKFDPNQEYQLAAIEAVLGLLEGQPKIGVEIDFQLGAALAAVPNRLDLTDEDLLLNLQAVQREREIPVDDALQCIEETIESADGSHTVRFPNFSVEMETGTGKTYVYLRTALELNRRFGLRKFIVVVPSVAIREGVLKTLRTTEGHLRQLYGNLPYRYYVYDSDNLTQVRQFALATSLEFMVMTVDSFNKAGNVIRQSTDWLQGETPIHLIQAARPVLILDEPQNMESELRVRALAALDPLLALRYSATHRNPYNIVYRLTPFEAYRQGLVKRIEVASVTQVDDENRVFLRLDEIRTERRTLTASIAVHRLMKDGTVKEKVILVRPGDDLETKTNRSDYAGFVVDEINAGAGFVRFRNNVELQCGEERGADRDAIFAAQVRYTVEEHLRKQARLKAAGIKVLSLFFIDRVDNYAREDGIIRRLFAEAFEDLKRAYPDWGAVAVADVQAAYFANRRRRGGAIEYVESVSGKTKEDEAAYDLIMREKERLLSFEEPVAFIFSHSALREGWDNPNVFQICTLNQTASKTKKRQEVGRGVRLAVNQAGDRVHDESANVLTVVANESYERYVATLQQELRDDYGDDGVPPPPPNARKKATARLRKEHTLKPEFKELWDRIRPKTRYAVKIDTEKLVGEAVPEIDQVEIRPPRVTVIKAEVRVTGADTLEAQQMTARKTAATLVRSSPIPNVVDLMASLMEHTSPPMRLTKRTLLEVLRRTTQQRAAVENPHEFATAATRVLKDKLADHLVNGIQYERIDEWYEMAQLDAEVDTWMDYLVPAEHSLYDQVTVDSEIEREFARRLDQRLDVKLFFKLPSWFVVQTPVGEYNPDWAIVLEDRDEHGQPTGKSALYLVRETKDRNWRTDLRPDERRKIMCGERHFRDGLGVDYRVVTAADELP